MSLHEIGKGDKTRGILCQLDDLVGMLPEKPDHDKNLRRHIGRFSLMLSADACMLTRLSLKFGFQTALGVF